MDIDDKLKVECIRCVREAFPEVELTVPPSFSPSPRPNRQIVLHLVDDRIYSLKSWSEAKAEDGWQDGCISRDKCFREIAFFVGAPNVCRAAYYFQIEHSYFDGYTLAVCEWMQNAESVDRFSAPTIVSIVENQEEFFRQLGEWYCLGYALDYRDWTPNNLVWSQRSKKLTLIDFDWSLGGGYPSTNSLCTMLGGLKDKVIASKKYSDSFSDGFRRMRSKISDSKSQVVGRMSDYSVCSGNLDNLEKFSKAKIDSLLSFLT